MTPRLKQHRKTKITNYATWWLPYNLKEFVFTTVILATGAYRTHAIICFGWTTGSPKLNALAPVDPLQKFLVIDPVQKIKPIPIKSRILRKHTLEQIASIAGIPLKLESLNLYQQTSDPAQLATTMLHSRRDYNERPGDQSSKTSKHKLTHT